MRTTHLSDETLLEMAEADTSHPHIAECERCRRRFEEVRDALVLARADQVPEPSPLFWDRFSARVHGEIENGTDVRPLPAFGWFPWKRVAVITALVVVVVAVNGWRVSHPGGSVRKVASSTTTTVAPSAGHAVAPADTQPVADLLVPEADSSWQIIAQVTANVHIANAADAGLVLQPDASDRAIAQLSPAEQQELVRLLQNDPDGPSQ
jgi:hypothetical protein